MQIRRLRRQSFLQPLAVLAVSAMAVVVAVILMIAHREDIHQGSATARLVENALASEQEAIRRTALAYSHWDAGFEHLHLQLDPAWIERNIGPWLADPSVPRLGLVLDPAGRTVYAARGAEPLERDAFALFPQGLARLVEEARATPLGARVARVRLLESDGLPHIVGVSVITPHQPAAYDVDMAVRSVLVIARRMGPMLLESIARRALLDELRLELGELPKGSAGVPLVDAEGHQLGALVWRTPRLLESVVPPLAIALLTMAGFSLVALGQTRQAGRALETGEQRFRDFAESASDWFWETDAEHRFTWMSPSVEEMTGVPAEWHYAKSRLELMAPGTDPARREAHRRVLEAHQPFREFEYLRRGPNGDTWISTSGVPVFDHKGRFVGYRGTGRDVTERVAAQERVRHLAQHDALTDLPNRVLLDDRLRQALAFARRNRRMVAVHVLDLDDFKAINDTLGHAAGDALLCQIARRLKGAVRACDTVARLGGDEFVIVQTEIDDRAAPTLLARRVIERLSAPFAIESASVSTTASIGIACFPEDGEDPKVLLRHADRALYAAKHSGRATHRFFRPHMVEVHRGRRRLEEALRRLIDEDAFGVAYRPLAELAGGRLVGAEAQLQVRDPAWMRVPIGAWLRAAETNGLIAVLARRLLAKACREAGAWPQRPGPLRLVLPLTAGQLAQADLEAEIALALAEADLPAERLELLLPASALADPAAEPMPLLTRLASAGIELSVDGLGVEALLPSRLRALPLSGLRLAGSLVARLPDDPEAARLVAGLLALTRGMGLRSCAPGVDRPAQQDWLRRHGCIEGLGERFGPALGQDGWLARIGRPTPVVATARAS